MTITPEKEIYVATQKAIEEVGVDEFKNTSMFRDGRKHTFITPEEVVKLRLKATQGDIVPLLQRAHDMAALIAELKAERDALVKALSLYSCEGDCDCLPGYEDNPLCGWNAYVALAKIKEKNDE